jgi:hypothetical protein
MYRRCLGKKHKQKKKAIFIENNVRDIKYQMRRYAREGKDRRAEGNAVYDATRACGIKCQWKKTRPVNNMYQNVDVKERTPKGKKVTRPASIYKRPVGV